MELVLRVGVFRQTAPPPIDIQHAAQRYLLRASQDGNPQEERAEKASRHASATAAEENPKELAGRRAQAQFGPNDC